jgi:hypothetical protein
MSYDDFDDYSDYDEDGRHVDDWNDADWAGYLGCDEEDLDQTFEDQMC